MMKAAIPLAACCLVTASLSQSTSSLTITGCPISTARSTPVYQQLGLERVDARISPSRESISPDELRDLNQKLNSAPDAIIKFENDPVAPLVIVGTSLRSVHRENPANAAARNHSTIDYFAVRMSISVKNSSSSEVSGFVLQLADEATKFELYRGETSVAPGKKETVKVEFMLVTVEPTNFTASLAGAQLSNGVIWGKFPINPPMEQAPQAPTPRSATPPRTGADHPSVPETPQTQPPASAAEASKQVLQLQIPASVDRRPIALNSPRASYTELARKNGVCGTVYLRVLVGPDGEVKATRLVRGLPDFLTEQAISAAYQLKFNPAIKGGQPVPYWQAITIDFNLR